MVIFFRLLVSFAFFLTVSAALPLDDPIIGATFAPADHPSMRLPPDSIAAAVTTTLGLNSVRILTPTPALIRSFLFSNATLFLSVPNYFVLPFASNRSLALLWLHGHVLPFYPRSKITLISVGNDVLSSSLIPFLLPAIRNLHESLLSLGILSVRVSTTFSLANIVTSPFPPSLATFREPLSKFVIAPLLRFLEDTNSSFLVNIYPYNIYRGNAQIPLGFVLFQEHPFNFRDDIVTGVRYQNLFDMMVDSVVVSMAVMGHQTIPIIVAETGWPSSSLVMGEGGDANPSLAEIYLRGLVQHLRSGSGTPLRREGVAGSFIYELVDENSSVVLGKRNWGLLYANLSRKYEGLHTVINQGSRSITREFTAVLWVVVSLVFLNL